MTLHSYLAGSRMVPHKTPSILQQLMPSRIWQMPNDQDKLYLTLDDGPIPGLTDWVLDVLKERGVKATFFCVGQNIKRHPQLLERILIEQHTVGNHTFNHLNGFETPKDIYLTNVEITDNALADLGVNTDLFRPPYGRLKYSQRKELGHKRIVMWDVLSKDYLQTLPEEEVLTETVKATEPGSIIVFHDNWKAEKNMKYALPRFVDHFLNKGFKFESL